MDIFEIQENVGSAYPFVHRSVFFFFENSFLRTWFAPVISELLKFRVSDGKLCKFFNYFPLKNEMLFFFPSVYFYGLFFTLIVVAFILFINLFLMVKLTLFILYLTFNLWCFFIQIFRRQFDLANREAMDESAEWRMKYDEEAERAAKCDKELIEVFLQSVHLFLYLV